MSARQAHLRRQMDKLAGRIAALESDRRFDGALHTAREETAWRAARRNAEAYRQAVEARRRAARLLLNACLLLVLMVLAACVLLAVDVQADLPPDRPAPAVDVQADLPPDRPAPAVRAIPAVPEPPEEPENERIEAALLERAVKLEAVTVTHYDPCVQCCGKTDGITASGVRATPGVTVAVDPAVIPLGSTVYADYGDGILHTYRAEDTGGAVRGNHIDLCVESHEEALALGVREAAVWWVAP